MDELYFLRSETSEYIITSSDVACLSNLKAHQGTWTS